MSWNVTIDEKQKKAQMSGMSIRQLVTFEPPRKDHNGDPLPGVLVTYAPGTKAWSGRGSQTYYPAHYTIHVVLSATHESDGKWHGKAVRHVDVNCQPSKALA